MEEELVVPQITTTDSKEEREDMVEDEEEDEFGISDVALSDDFFVGLDGFASPAAEDFFPDHFPATFALPNWVANNAGWPSAMSNADVDYAFCDTNFLAREREREREVNCVTF